MDRGAATHTTDTQKDAERAGKAKACSAAMDNPINQIGDVGAYLSTFVNIHGDLGLLGSAAGRALGIFLCNFLEAHG